MDENAIRELFAVLMAEALAPVNQRISDISDALAALAIPDVTELTERVALLENHVGEIVIPDVGPIGEQVAAMRQEVDTMQAELATVVDPGETDPNSPAGIRTAWIDKVLPKYFGGDYPS